MRVPLVLLALPLAALSAVTDETDLPGVVSLVGGRDGVERISCCGYADIARRRRMESDTLFWIASNTKAIAAALMLTEVDEGLVSLDDPVDRYLPEFSRLRVEDPSAAVPHVGAEVLSRHAHRPVAGTPPGVQGRSGSAAV